MFAHAHLYLCLWVVYYVTVCVWTSEDNLRWQANFPANLRQGIKKRAACQCVWKTDFSIFFCLHLLDLSRSARRAIPSYRAGDLNKGSYFYWLRDLTTVLNSQTYILVFIEMNAFSLVVLCMVDFMEMEIKGWPWFSTVRTY